MEINNIIREEVEDFLNKENSIKEYKFTFRQKIEKSSFYEFQNFSNDFDVDINASDVIANWHVVLHVTDTSIKLEKIDVDSVEGTFNVVLLDKQTNEVNENNVKNIAETPWRFQVVDGNLLMGQDFLITTLDFNFETKICNVTFNNPEIQN